MVDIEKADVVNFATALGDTKLAAAPDGLWNEILPYVNLTNLTECDDDVTRRLVRILLAAHMATMGLRSAHASAGPITGESSGNVRRSYGLVAASGSPGSYTQTRYGLQYMDILKRSLVAGPMVI